MTSAKPQGVVDAERPEAVAVLAVAVLVVVVALAALETATPLGVVLVDLATVMPQAAASVVQESVMATLVAVLQVVPMRLTPTVAQEGATSMRKAQEALANPEEMLAPMEPVTLKPAHQETAQQLSKLANLPHQEASSQKQDNSMQWV